MVALLTKFSKYSSMQERNWELYLGAQEEHNELLKQVGELSLLPEAGPDGYVLATLHTLNRDQDKPTTQDQLEDTLRDIANYRLWDTPEDGEPIIESPIHVHRTVVRAIGNLADRGWIDRDLALTDLGEVVLADMAIPAKSR